MRAGERALIDPRAFRHDTMEKKPAEAPIYSFGEYELDTRLHELRRARERLHIEPHQVARAVMFGYSRR